MLIQFLFPLFLGSQAGAVTTAKEAPIENLREAAGQELAPAPEEHEQVVPSVMLPLQDDYMPKRARAWTWNLEARLVQQRMMAPRPDRAFGPKDLKELGVLPFFGLTVGAEKSFWGETIGINAFTAYSSRKNDGTSTTGISIPLRAQSLTYGIEANWIRLWLPHWGTEFGYNFALVHATQSSGDDELSNWSTAYAESGPRLALEYYLNKKTHDSSRLSLAYYQRNTQYGSDDSWSFGYGVKW